MRFNLLSHMGFEITAVYVFIRERSVRGNEDMSPGIKPD